MILTSEFDYNLPEELIAQRPAERRDKSRLLVLDRHSGLISHRVFTDLAEFLRPGDVIVLNNSRVIPARLRGANAKSGGAIEVLLVEENNVNDWWTMLKPGRRARIGTEIVFYNKQKQRENIRATVIEINSEGHRRLKFDATPDIVNELERLGEPPLPPYIHRPADDKEDAERYQTVFATQKGSVAAPTAGLHFTQEFLELLKAKGVEIAYITLHIGLGTFAPVKVEQVEEHIMHTERYELPQETVEIVRQAKAKGKKVLAVGTTVIRTLETVAKENNGELVACKGRTQLFIYPPYQFKVADMLLTNFHLPRSTLLMLVSAFAEPGGMGGKDLVLKAYQEAIELRYRFYSYGDAMLII